MKLSSKATSVNPKGLLGNKKVPMGAVPPVATAYESLALLEGELKYGYRNWRATKVQARVYVDACKRHLDSWLEGEEVSEINIHHLGHARACLAILLDAQASGCLIDDRVNGPLPRILKSLEPIVAAMRAKYSK